MKTILVIEDNTEMRENLVGILELPIYRVIQATNGQEGVKLALESKPDLILCDLGMPGMDGFSVLTEIKSNPKTKRIPFIFLTAFNDESARMQGAKLGADDYIIKPFEGQQLLSTIGARIVTHRDFPRSVAEITEPIFDYEASEADLYFDLLEKSKPLKVYEKKDVIFEEGQVSAIVIIIDQGKIKTFKSTVEGKEIITGFHEAGDLIGFEHIINEDYYAETAVALEGSSVYRVAHEDFSKLLEYSKAFRVKFIKLLALALTDTQKRLLEVAYCTVRQRVANTLVRISNGHEHTSPNTFVISESRKDISAFIGTAIESLNRTLTDFKDEGLIEITDSGIVLLDRNRLIKFKG